MHCSTRLPCPSLSPTAHWNSCTSSWWCRPTISSSVVPFSSCLQSIPASGSFPMSQLSASGGQSTGVSASASVLLVNMQGWFPLGFWLVWSSCCWRDSQESSPTPQLESINSSALSLLDGPNLMSVHDYWKNKPTLTMGTFVGKVMSLLFNTLSRLFIAFLKCQPCARHCSKCSYIHLLT